MTTLGLITLALLLVGFGLVYTGSRDMDSGGAEERMGGAFISLAGWCMVGGGLVLTLGAVFWRVFFS